MTNPIYVSSSDIPDVISIQVKNPYIFQSLATNMTVKDNYLKIEDLPPMIESSERKTMMKMGEYSKNSMFLTLIIPFCFLIFLSASMDSVWSMYLMLQIVCNMMFMIINRPGNADYILFIG